VRVAGGDLADGHPAPAQLPIEARLVDRRRLRAVGGVARLRKEEVRPPANAPRRDARDGHGVEPQAPRRRQPAVASDDAEAPLVVLLGQREAELAPQVEADLRQAHDPQGGVDLALLADRRGHRVDELLADRADVLDLVDARGLDRADLDAGRSPDVGKALLAGEPAVGGGDLRHVSSPPAGLKGRR